MQVYEGMHAFHRRRYQDEITLNETFLLISALYLVSLIIALLTSLMLIVRGYRQRDQPFGTWVMASGVATGLVSTFYLIGTLPGVSIQVAYTAALLRIPMNGVTVVTIMLTIFAYTGMPLRLSTPLRLMLYLFNVLTLLIALILPTAIFQEWRLLPYGIIQVDQVRFGAWFSVHTVFSVTLLIGALLTLYWRMRRETGIRRIVLGWLMVAVGLVIVLAIIAIPLRDRLPVNLTPLGLVLFVLIFAQLLFRYRLIEIMPFAFSSIFNSMSDGMIYVTTSGQINQINSSALRLLGHDSPDPLLAQPFDSALPAIARAESGSELAIPRPDGDAIWLDVRTNPAVSVQGKRIGTLIVLRDITANRLLRDALRDQERLTVSLQKEQELSDLKTRMMIRIGHEFRTPLANIQLSGEILEKYADRLTTKKHVDQIATIRAQTRAIAVMLDEIAIVIRGEFKQLKIDPHPFNLPELAQSAVGQISRRYLSLAPIVIVNTMQNEMITADRTLIETLLRHLLTNATQFSPPDRPIRLELEETPDTVILRVCDQGIGIELDEQGRVFEAFFRGRNIGEIGGLGLGLTIAHDIVTLHQGTIALDSTPGAGTTVTVTFPRR